MAVSVSYYTVRRSDRQWTFFFYLRSDGHYVLISDAIMAIFSDALMAVLFGWLLYFVTFW